MIGLLCECMDAWRRKGGHLLGACFGAAAIRFKGHTFTQAFADSAFANLTLMIPSLSLSNKTTFVTSPSLAHSSRMSSLMSRIAAGSTYQLLLESALSY